MLTRDEFLKIYNEGPDVTYQFVLTLLERIVDLTSRVEHIESQLKKNSSNSSKPPSSDGFKKPNRTQSLRKKSDKKPGGQKGHDGFVLKQVNNPDYTLDVSPTHCCNCHGSLKNAKKISSEKKQVFDLPEITVESTEYFSAIVECNHCGTVNVGNFPEGVTMPAQYGNRLKSLAVYFMNQQLLPYNRTQQIFQEIFGQNISTGSLYNFNKECFVKLERTEQRIKKELKNASVLHNDETGMYINGKRDWMHSSSTEEATYYAHHEKRGREAIDAVGILSGYEGIAVHDHWDAYYHYNCSHALCNSHHLRELKFMAEIEKEVWAEKMRKCLLAIKGSVEYYCRKGKLPDDLTKRYTARYTRILKEGFSFHDSLPALPKVAVRGRRKQRPGKNLLDRLKGNQKDVLAFMNDFRIPFDNNLAERDIRMVKLKQKISGCYRSVKGADFFCRIRGYISTLRKKNLEIFTSINDAFRGLAPI